MIHLKLAVLNYFKFYLFVVSKINTFRNPEYLIEFGFVSIPNSEIEINLNPLANVPCEILEFAFWTFSERVF